MKRIKRKTEEVYAKEEATQGSKNHGLKDKGITPREVYGQKMTSGQKNPSPVTPRFQSMFTNIKQKEMVALTACFPS